MKHIIKCRLGKYPTKDLRNVIIPDSPLICRLNPGDKVSFVSPGCTVDCLALGAPTDQVPCDGCFIYRNVATGIQCFDQCGGRCVVISTDDVLEEL